MIGLVLVTHGQLAAEFRHAVEHVVGPQDNFETVAIGADDDMEQRRSDIVEAVARVDKIALPPTGQPGKGAGLGAGSTECR